MSGDPVTIILVGARWLHFASLYALLGGGAFWLTAGRDAPAGSRRAMAAGLRLAAPLAVASGLAWLDASLAGMAGGFAATLDPGFLGLFFLATPFGGVAIARLVLLAALLATPALPRPTGTAAGIAGALLVSQAWLGHAAEGGPAARWMIASYAIHLLAGAVWLGGLPPLLLVLAEDRRGGVAALGRFSWVATAAAAAVLVTGAANTLFHGGWDVAALAASDYGRVLAIKLAFVAAMLLPAAATRFVVLPRLRRSERASPSRAIAVEIAAGLMVLLAAAVLGITAPPR